MIKEFLQKQTKRMIVTLPCILSSEDLHTPTWNSHSLTL